MKVFLAIPYSQLCDEDKYEIKNEYRQFFSKLIFLLKKINCDYFLAHERENWGKQYSSAEESTMIDFETIKNVDLVCAIPGIPNSGGVHVEIGWASANKKKILVYLKNGGIYSPMITGIHTVTDAKYFYYDDDYSNELCKMILENIKDYMENK